MFIADMFLKTALRAPEGEGDVGGSDTIAGGDDTLAADGNDTLAADDPAPVAKWWEDKRYDDVTQAQLKALGLTVDDPLDVINSFAKMERSAKVKLGKGVDQLLEKPGEGQDAGTWLRQHGEMFGIPETPEKYEVKPPESWPKDQAWDTEFETTARQMAHEAGISGAALQKFTDLYAGKVAGLLGTAEADFQAANETMQADLQKDWGAEYNAKIARVQQISGVLAERAGLDSEAMEGLSAALKPKIGDANIIRLFDAVAELGGDDMAAGLMGGGGGIGTTPADARAQLEAMKSPESEYSKAQVRARETGDRAQFNELHKSYLRLSKIAAS